MGNGCSPLGGDERARYHRQIILPGWGEGGQEKLKEATVFIAGAGGLGCAVGTYLAAAGVGRIRICDDGEVEVSNLNRQILYTDRDVGRKKADAAREALSRMNPYVQIEELCEGIESGTISELLADSAIAVDCLDNFGARLILNEHAVKASLPFVHAGARGMSGQITFIKPPETPCLRCVFPAPPPDETLNRDCQALLASGTVGSAESEGEQAIGTLPVIGAAPGVMGSLEALEVLKYLTGAGELLMGRLLLWDGAIASFEEIPVRKDPACRVCGGGAG